MKETAGRLAAIARVSAQETLRSRSMLVAAILNALLLLLLAGSAVLILNELPEELAAQLGSERAREAAVRAVLLVAQGLASLMALFIGIFASVGAIGNEIDRGTILAVAARPVERWEIVIGKFLGNSVLAVLYLVVQVLVIGLVLALITGVWVNDLFVSAALLSLNVLVVVAVSLAGSTRLSVVPNAIAVTALLFALSGPATGILYGLALLTRSELLQQAVDLARFALPVTPVSDLAAQILGGPGARALRAAAGEASLLPVRDWVWVYAIGYLVVMLALASWSLSRRDLR